MSESKRLGRMDYFRSALSGKGPQLMEQYDKRGLKVLIFPGFFIRQEVILRQRMIMENRLLDPVDRVHEADSLLWVAGLVYARGTEKGSTAWTRAWGGWNGELQLFNDHASQRSWYKTETLLEITEMIPMMKDEVQDDGTSKVVESFIPTQRQVRQDTWDAIQIVDAHLLQAKNVPKGWEPAKLLKATVITPDPEVKRLKQLTGYDELSAEEAIGIWARDMMKWAALVLNLSFHDKDTPSQTGDVFQYTQPMMGQTPGGRIPGQSTPPDWNLSPADKEQRG